MRCARTDKGVHAAGNVISLKLVIQDPAIVSKINDALPPQIRVWGIEQTNKSFSAYGVCESRIYEYLIPTYCFLPPHPQTFLGQQIVELAEEANDLDGFKKRQEEVADFWDKTHNDYISPIVDSLDPSLREEVLHRFYNQGYLHNAREDIRSKEERAHGPSQDGIEADVENKLPNLIEQYVRELKSAQASAKRAWRIPESRLERVRSILSRFVGTIKYHNYTVDKSWHDPSAIRIIKSFTVDEKPVIIGETEWLSLKVHGQSFMMHQIRKMVSAAALIIRCGCHEGRLQDTYLRDKISVPKAPSLGLLLERPVFDKYNEKLVEFGKATIDFGKHKEQVNEFKQREIYERIFEVEEREGIFLSFFAGLDSTRSASLLWATSAGLKGTQKILPQKDAAGEINANDLMEVEEEDEHGSQEDN